MDETVTMSRENYDELHRSYQEKIKTAGTRLRERSDLAETQIKNGKHYHDSLDRVANAIMSDAWKARTSVPEADRDVADVYKAPLDVRATMSAIHSNLDEVLMLGIRAYWSK